MKGFTSSFNAITRLYNSVETKLKQLYVTFQHQGSGKVGMMTAPRWLSSVSTGNTIDASGSTKNILSIASHGHAVHDVIRFTSGPNIGHEVQIEDVSDSDSVLLAQTLPNTPTGSDTYTLLRSMSPTLDSSGNITTSQGSTTVVDFLDNGSMVPSGANAIPASGSSPLEVVNSLAQSCSSIQIISDVGEFINLYLDSAGSTLIAHITLTPDEVVDVDIPAGSTIYIRNAKNAVIDDANSILSMNFIG